MVRVCCVFVAYAMVVKFAWLFGGDFGRAAGAGTGVRCLYKCAVGPDRQEEAWERVQALLRLVRGYIGRSRAAFR
jgi:hypothetical protein